MVVTLLVIARKIYGVENIITVDHLEKMNIVILLTGTMVGFAYITEFFVAWYSGVQYEQYAFTNRMFGPYAWAYWTMMSCNLFFPQFFWFKKLRRNITFMFIISIFVNIGMWFERFVITVTLASPRLPTELLGLLHAHIRRRTHFCGNVRPLLHLLPALPEILTHRRGI